MVEWNKRTYDTHKANCQHFVNDAVEAMGIKIPTEGALGKRGSCYSLTGLVFTLLYFQGSALKRLQSEGILRMSYTPPAHLNMKEIIFETHFQLDEYFVSILEQIPQFRDRHPHDCALLKAYGNRTPHQYHNSSNQYRSRLLVDVP